MSSIVYCVACPQAFPKQKVPITLFELYLYLVNANFFMPYFIRLNAGKVKDTKSFEITNRLNSHVSFFTSIYVKRYYTE